MRLLRTPNLWLGLGAILIFVFLLVKAQAIDSERHTQFSSDLRRLNELDAIITQNLLKSRFELLSNYDPLVRDLDELKRIQSQIAQTPSFIDELGARQFGQQRDEYKEIIKQKESLIDDFKSRHPIYRNSRRYILSISTQLAQASPSNNGNHGDPQSMADLNHLMQNIVIYNSMTDDDLSSQIMEQISQIGRKISQYTALLKGRDINLAHVMSHSQVILVVKPQLDATIEKVSSLPTSQQGERLIKVYDYHYQRALQTSNFYRLSLFLFSLLTLGYVASVIIIRLRKAEQVLAEYNRTLEEEVSERTAQLGKANEEISTLNQQLKSENLRLGAELNVSRELQQMLLPTEEELRRIEYLDIASFMEPADEVGGDYVDVLQHNGHVKIGIGDVTGHGLESGVLMLMTQTAVRTLLISGESDPTRFLSILNRTIYDNIQRMQGNKSLTLTLLDYEQGGNLRFSGQHEDLIVIRKGGQIELIDTMDLGFPIGLADDIAEFVDKLSIKLEPGDGVVLYTDGITEAENISREQYGVERMCTILSRHWQYSAEAIKDVVIEDLRSFIGQQKVYDDITLLIIKQI
ncbi:MAG: DAHL domain-containing protein [Ardenticatenaceae bacterium]